MMKLFELKFGSTLYDTRTENSDLDLKSVYLPTKKEIILGTYKKTISTQRPKSINERNTKDDIDIEIFSLDRYLKLLSEGQTVALDVLFGAGPDLPVNWYASYIWTKIQDNKEKLITKDVTAFIGYSRQQSARYGIKGSRMEALKRVVDLLKTFPSNSRLLDHIDQITKLCDENRNIISLEKTPLITIMNILGSDKKTFVPHLEVCGKKYPLHQKTKDVMDNCSRIFEEYGNRSHKSHLNGGKDFKALSHAVRVNSQGIELLRTGKITFPRPDKELLIKIKTNQIPYEEISEIIEQGLIDLVEAQKYSTLRDKPDLEWIDNFVEEVYSEIVQKSHNIFNDWEMEKWDGK